MQLINTFLGNLYLRARSLKQEAGQTLVEYGLILALISIVVIFILGAVGGQLETVFETIRDELGGAVGGEGGEGADGGADGA